MERIGEFRKELSPIPVGNHGETLNPDPMTSQPKTTIPIQDRTRVQVELSPSVSLLLDHVCEVTGANKSQVVLSALMDALPGLLERSDAFQKRSSSLAQSQAAKKR